MRFVEGRVNRQTFIRYLLAHQAVAAQDMGNELKYYDRENMVQGRQPERNFFEEVLTIGGEMGGNLLEYPDRILQLATGYGEPD